jgi:hypothetical protein
MTLSEPDHWNSQFCTKDAKLGESILPVHLGRLTNVVSHFVLIPEAVPECLGTLTIENGSTIHVSEIIVCNVICN